MNHRSIDLQPQYLDIIFSILRKNIPDRNVIAFGSRVHGRAKKYSDIDLCVMGDTPLDTALHAKLKDAFSESDLPIKVDIVDWATTSPDFRKIIADQAVDFF